MSPIRVLHLIAGLDRRDGGPVAALEGLVRAQMHVGLAPFILATPRAGEDASISSALASHRIDVHAVSPAATGGPRWSSGLRPALRRAVAAADVVHLHGTWECIHLFGIREALAQRKPAFLRPCGMLEPWSLRQGSPAKRLWYRLLLRRQLQRLTGFHLVTERESRLVAELGLTAPRIVIPNGVARTHAPRARTAQDSRLVRLVFLGRLHPKKGLDLLIRAIARVVLDGYDVALDVAGEAADPAYQVTLSRLVAELGLESRVRFLGHLNDAGKSVFWSNADLLIVPSYQENFGNVVVEAAAAGVPSLVSEQVYLAEELVAAGAGGVIPFQRDWTPDKLTGSIADALDQWLSVPATRQEAAAHTAEFAAGFDWEPIARRWAEIYSSAIAR